MGRKKRVIITIVIIIAILISIISIFLTYYKKDCSSLECFNSALETCSRASFIYEQVDSSWRYNILGQVDGKCSINVQLLQLKQGKMDIIGFEGKEMICEMPFGFVALPQNNLESCHGLLKEEMQSLIINRLHNYIVDNLGKIEEELERI